MANIAAICINDEQDVAASAADHLDATFAIVPAIIRSFERYTHKNARGVVKPKPSLAKRAMALRIVPFEHPRFTKYA